MDGEYGDSHYLTEIPMMQVITLEKVVSSKKVQLSVL
jgi:hypothetical protein